MNNVSARSWLLASALSLSVLLPAALHAQTIFVADPNGANGVSSYNIDGTLINSSLVNLSGSAPTYFEGLALSGSTLYVAKSGASEKSIGAYTLDGAGGVTASTTAVLGGGMTGLNNPWGVAVTASNMFITDFNSGNVFKYDLSGNQLANVSAGTTNPYGLAVSGDTLFVSQATTGTGMNKILGYSISSFSNTPTLTITANLNLPHGLAVSGNTLYVANGGDGTIWTFNAIDGTPAGSALVSGLTGPQGIMVYGTDLFVSGNDGTVKGFDALTGAPLAGFTTITGLSSPYGIAVGPMSAVPEPATYAALAGLAALGLACWRRCRMSSGGAS